MRAALAHRFEADRLMVILPDRPSDLIAKGELTERYYNPGELFREVHIVVTNDDQPDLAKLQKTVGDAKLYFHNLPTGRELFLKSLGWRPILLKAWGDRAADLARGISPELIRCHGNNLNAYAALAVKRRLGVPYVISLHGNPDVDYYRGRLARTPMQRLIGRAIESVEIQSVIHADMVLPVYSPIVPYLKKHDVSRYEIVYNTVGHNCVLKSDYRLKSGLVKAICVGRQEDLQKDPSEIIKAVAELQNVSLMLIGQGNLHVHLQSIVDGLGLSQRVRLIAKMPNSEVLHEMSRSDIFVYSSINYEISKACMEAALIGLPVVVNDRNGEPAEELIEAKFLLVKNTKEGYRAAFERLIGDEEERRRIGEATRQAAEARWSPDVTEQRVVEIYRSLLARSSVRNV